MSIPIRSNPSWVRVLPSVTLIFTLVACTPSLRPLITSCAADDQVPAKVRESVGQVALKFVQDALGPDPSAAFRAFTADTRKGLSFTQFLSGIENQIKPMAPFKDLNVAHTYLADITGGDQEERVVCGNLSSPEGWVAVNAKPGTAAAHVIVEGQTLNNTHVFAFRLVTEQGNWHVQYVHFVTAGMVGKSADDLWRMAATEHQRQHRLNAFVLYTAALQMADRGPLFQLGIKPEIEKGMRDISRPPFLEGQPPFVWNLERFAFKVSNIGLTGLGGKIYLVVDHEIEPWGKDNVADRTNRDLMTAFAQVYQEYKDVFAGLVVTAHERGGDRSFTTVDEE